MSDETTTMLRLNSLKWSSIHAIELRSLYREVIVPPLVWTRAGGNNQEKSFLYFRKFRHPIRSQCGVNTLANNAGWALYPQLPVITFNVAIRPCFIRQWLIALLPTVDTLLDQLINDGLHSALLSFIGRRVVSATSIKMRIDFMLVTESFDLVNDLFRFLNQPKLPDALFHRAFSRLDIWLTGQRPAAVRARSTAATQAFFNHYNMFSGCCCLIKIAVHKPV